MSERNKCILEPRQEPPSVSDLAAFAKNDLVLQLASYAGDISISEFGSSFSKEYDIDHRLAFKLARIAVADLVRSQMASEISRDSIGRGPTFMAVTEMLRL